MTIDKQKLQKLLWAEAASYRADCADWKRNTEALQEFLGEKTVEEVALELLEENERLATQFRLAGVSAEVTVHQEVGRAITETLSVTIERDRLKAENEALRKDAKRLHSATAFVQKLCDSAGKQPSVATGYLHDILSAMSKGEQS
jgi:hypothetical protein